jgi:hypothetical protein
MAIATIFYLFYLFSVGIGPNVSIPTSFSYFDLFLTANASITFLPARAILSLPNQAVT